MAYGQAQLMPLVHPTFVLRDDQADRYTFDNYMTDDPTHWRSSLGTALRLIHSRLQLAFRCPGHYPRKLLALARNLS